MHGFPERLLRVIRVRFTLSLFYANLLWTSPVYSQRSLTSFGPCADLSLDYHPSGLTITSISARSSPAQVVVLAKDKPVAYTYAVGPRATIRESGALSLAHSGRALVAADLDGDGVTDIAVLSSDGTTISFAGVVREKGRENKISLETPSQRLGIADINNDRRIDILAYGKKRSGIATFLGRPDGSFRRGEVLFPEISVSELRTADLNGDGITDVLLLDWLSNNLAVFYGIGRGVFSEQVALPLPSEPAGLAMTPVSKQRTIRAAIAFPELREIAVYGGNATGEFDTSTVLSCPSPPFQVGFVDVNGDQHSDIVASSSGGLLVYLGKSATQFGPPAIFGTGDESSSWAVGDIDGDAKTDLALIDLSSQRLVMLGNAAGNGQLSASTHYAVGPGPHGLAARDLNGNGLPDLAVANEGSSSISLLYNSGGTLTGQYSLHAGEGPTYIKTALSSGGPERTLVASHSAADMITVVRLADDLSKSESFTIPTGTRPFVVFAKEKQPSAMLEMLVRHVNPRDGSLTLSLFQEIGGGQFLEKSLRPNLPQAISALTMDAFSTEGTYDLVFVTGDRATRRSTVSIARASAGFDFTGVRPLLSYEDSTQSTRSAIAGNVDDDQLKDIMLLFGAPRNGLGIVFGRSGGVFSDSLEMVKGVQAVSDDAVIMKDMDGDGHRDIALIDGLKNAIMVLYGRGNGRFDLPVMVTQVAPTASFRVVSMTGRRAQDLIFSDAARGTVSILYDPFRKR